MGQNVRQSSKSAGDLMEEVCQGLAARAPPEESPPRLSHTRALPHNLLCGMLVFYRSYQCRGATEWLVRPIWSSLGSEGWAQEWGGRKQGSLPSPGCCGRLPSFTDGGKGSLALARDPISQQVAEISQLSTRAVLQG